MRNGFFRLISIESGFGIRFYAPVDGGEAVKLQQVAEYLDRYDIMYTPEQLKNGFDPSKDCLVRLSTSKACPAIDEQYTLQISPDFMLATANFIPCSQTGKRLSEDEFLKDLSYRQIRAGIQTAIIKKHFETAGYYGIDVPVAKGQPPRHGTDARIEYYFNTNLQARPEQNEDGSVDYFNLNLINPVQAGDVLARIIPEDPGDYGMNIQGAKIKPREVKRAHLHFGRNISYSEDRLSIISDVSGLVMLAGEDVFVSNVYEVENVDNSTGNIDFDGSVQINGNVATNFEVKATGNINVKGVVEGAKLVAGGNIIISRGMNGMSKGELYAGGNIAAKFIENATVSAEGYVNTESILHSKVSAGTEIIVTGKKGFITGGVVQAESLIEVRTLGATMGASTVVEVGASPKLKNQYLSTQKEVAEIVRTIKNAQLVVQNFMEKKAKGARITEDQMKYVKENAALLETKKVELETKSKQMQELAEQISPDKKAVVKVTGEVYPGTTIVIGDLSLNVQDSYKYCRFERVNGDVKMLPL